MANVVDNTDGYSRAVAGIQIEAVRAGRGVGPNTVTSIRDQRFVTTDCRIGFPMLTRTTIGDGRILLARIDVAVPGSRWCHIDLEPGMTLVYAPGAEHTAINLPGLRFAFAIARQDQLEARADRLRVRVAPPPRGQVRVLPPTARTAAVGAGLAALTDTVRRGATAVHKLGEDLIDTVTLALSEHDRTRTVGAGRGLDSRRIVHDCIDYAMAVERIPSLSELCLAAHVSERRLRHAFKEEFDLPPTRFFRLWGLSEARRRLLRGGGDRTVSRVVTDLGFGHLGRFAGYYRQLYGETPSATIRAIRSTPTPRENADPREPGGRARVGSESATVGPRPQPSGVGQR